MRGKFEAELLNFASCLSINGHMTNWDDHRFFLAVAREASVRKAAETLNTSRSTVLRRITALEDELGVRLFERMPNGYFATPAGEELRRAAERMEAEADTAERRLAGRDAELSGTIRVSVPGVLATYLLMRDFAAFNQAHPEIRLQIVSTYEMPDLARREVDVAIRISNDPPDDLVGRRILKMARAAYVSADHLPNPAGPAPPRELSWIGWSLDPSSLQWVEESGYPNLPVNTIITDPYVTIEAVRAGIGMSILPCFMGDTEPGLHRMPPGRLQRQSDLWVLTHEDLRNTARIRVFTSFVADALLRHRDLMEGRAEGS